MSGAQHLPVAPEKVTAVLLADGWHPVALGSFTVGTLSFSDDHAVAGYGFEELSDTSLYRSVTLTGPLNAVLAVRQVTSRRPPQQDGIGETVTERARRAASVPQGTRTDLLRRRLAS